MELLSLVAGWFEEVFIVCLFTLLLSLTPSHIALLCFTSVILDAPLIVRPSVADWGFP